MFFIYVDLNIENQNNYDDKTVTKHKYDTSTFFSTNVYKISLNIKVNTNEVTKHTSVKDLLL